MHDDHTCTVIIIIVNGNVCDSEVVYVPNELVQMNSVTSSIVSGAV